MGTSVDIATAIGKVRIDGSADTFPEIDDVMLEVIVANAARPDADGTLPSEDGWTPTFDLNAATADVWDVKAGRVANRFDIVTDHQSLNRSQMVAHFRSMAALYRGRTSSTLRRERPS